MGESVTSAIVSTILKPSGSYVKADEEIVELETDKVNQVLYAPQAGTLTLTVAKDQTVKIGQVIGYVETDAKAPAPAETKSAATPAPAPPPTSAAPKPSDGPTSRIMAPEFVAGLKEKETTTTTFSRSTSCCSTCSRKSCRWQEHAQKDEQPAQSDRAKTRRGQE